MLLKHVILTFIQEFQPWKHNVDPNPVQCICTAISRPCMYIKNSAKSPLFYTKNLCDGVGSMTWFDIDNVTLALLIIIYCQNGIHQIIWIIYWKSSTILVIILNKVLLLADVRKDVHHRQINVTQVENTKLS